MTAGDVQFREVMARLSGVWLQTPLRRQSTGAGDDDVYALTTQLGREVFMLGFKVAPPLVKNVESLQISSHSRP